jgi:6-phosphogluconolactonase
MELLIENSPEELGKSLAGWITDYVRETLYNQNSFSLVFSGGNTPRALYHLLSEEPYKSKIDWDRIVCYWGDERYVAFEDERSNAKMVYESLLDHVPVKKENIHIIRTDISPEESSLQYEVLLRKHFPDENKTFDLVLLGLGDNGHTLSLFPGYEEVIEEENWVRSFFLEEQQMHRITLTAPPINAARRVAFLVSGIGKAASVKNILQEKFNPELYPAQIIRPEQGELFWWMDEAAASLIH